MSLVGAFVQLLLTGLAHLAPERAPAPAAAPAGAAGRPFINYQIDTPAPDRGEPVASAVLLQHDFAASWGRPHTVPYSAPSREFTHVQLTLEVETFGIQYDRLAHLSIGGVEVWRPSTSEPRGQQSLSSHSKDLSLYRALFERDGEISLELNNLVTERLNGTFNVTLSAAYFAPRSDAKRGPSEWFEHDGRAPARVEPVLPLQVATGPREARISQLPRNTTRAVLEVFVSGNGNDEFWYAESSLDPADDSTGPVRHLIAAINNDTAGVIAPFQQIYTGGFQPALWSPFVGVKAYDVPSYHIDVTPFLPDLWAADAPISFVVKDSHHGIVTHEWIVSAALLTWEEPRTHGSGVRHAAAASNHSASVLIPGTEITTFTSKVNVSADLEFAGRPVRVEWLQEQSTDAVIHGELVVSHGIEATAAVAYADSVYSTSHNYSLVLALEERSIAVVHALSSSDVNAPAGNTPRDPRKRSVRYNGTWYNGDARGKNVHNGSDVTVDTLDPWQPWVDGDSDDEDNAAPFTLHMHAKSRNGSVVSLQTTAVPDVDLSIADASPARQWVSADLCPETLQKNREIRHAWLRHSL